MKERERRNTSKIFLGPVEGLSFCTGGFTGSLATPPGQSVTTTSSLVFTSSRVGLVVRVVGGGKLDLDLGEVQVWEHENNLFSKVLEAVPIVTPHFIEIGLRSLILLNGLFLRLPYMLKECSHFRL